MSVDLGLWVSKLLDLSKGEKKKKNHSQENRNKNGKQLCSSSPGSI